METTKLDTAKIERIIKAIEGAGVIMVDDSPMLHSLVTADRTGEDVNEVIYASWYDGLKYVVNFTEGGLSAAKITKNMIECEDSEGSSSVIELFDLVPKTI